MARRALTVVLMAAAASPYVARADDAPGAAAVPTSTVAPPPCAAPNLSLPASAIPATAPVGGPSLTKYEVDKHVLQAIGLTILADIPAASAFGDASTGHGARYFDPDAPADGAARTRVLVAATLYAAAIDSALIGTRGHRWDVFTRALLASAATMEGTVLLANSGHKGWAAATFLLGRYVLTPAVAAAPVYGSLPRANVPLQQARPERDPANLTR